MTSGTLNPRDSPFSSPCVGRCSHCTGDYICRGCGRSVEEVRDWNTYSDEKKVEVKKLAKWRIENGQAN